MYAVLNIIVKAVANNKQTETVVLMNIASVVLCSSYGTGSNIFFSSWHN